MTLLALIQAVCARIGIPRPLAAFGSADMQIQQLLALLEEECQSLISRHSWAALRKRATFVAAGTEALNGFWPSDFDRFVESGTGYKIYNETDQQWLVGPLSASEWAQHRDFPTMLPVWRVLEGTLTVSPAPVANSVMSFEYVSRFWCQTAQGTPTGALAADTDTFRLPETVLRLGLVWRWYQVKGLDYAEAMSNYERQLERVASADGGGKSAQLTSAPSCGEQLSSFRVVAP